MMTNFTWKLKRRVTALFLWLLVAYPAAAQDVSNLLEQLKSVAPEQAEELESEIALIWSRSGSDAMDLLLERGRRALRKGDPKAALEHLTALTDHAPDFAEGWNARATAFYALGQYGPAISDVQRTLALNPNHFRAMSGLAAMLEEMGDYEMALKVQQKVASIHPHKGGVREAIERLSLRLGSAEL